MNRLKQLYNYLEKYWNEPTPTETEIKVNGMMKICFNNEDTENSVATLELFITEARAELSKRNLQANIDSNICNQFFKNNLIKE